MKDIVNPIDLHEIVLKNYNNFVELRSDFAWFSHNCLIKFSKRHIIAKAAKKIKALLEQEIQNLLLCSECYKNAYDHPDDCIIWPCTKPHILVWANCDDYGFWPAKVMNCDGQNICVRFFGDYTSERLESSRCYILSEEIPQNQHGPASGSSFELALHVSLKRNINF